MLLALCFSQQLNQLIQSLVGKDEQELKKVDKFIYGWKWKYEHKHEHEYETH